MIVAEQREVVDGGLHRGIEAEPWLPEHRAGPRVGEVSDLFVVADDIERQWTRRVENLVGHPAGEHAAQVG